MINKKKLTQRDDYLRTMLGYKERAIARKLRLSIRAENDLAEVVNLNTTNDGDTHALSLHSNSINLSSVGTDPGNQISFEFVNPSVLSKKFKEPKKNEDGKSVLKIKMKFFRISNQIKIVFWSMIYMIFLIVIVIVLTFVWN